MNNNQKFTSFKDMFRNNVRKDRITRIAKGECIAKIPCKFCAFQLLCTSSNKDKEEQNGN